jgi:hypothetical protein
VCDDVACVKPQPEDVIGVVHEDRRRSRRGISQRQQRNDIVWIDVKDDHVDGGCEPSKGASPVEKIAAACVQHAQGAACVHRCTSERRWNRQFALRRQDN